MLEHVRVAGTGLLNETELSGLGRINVVCGRNNSGKTTLLAALTRNEGCHPGLAYTEQLVARFALAYTAGTVFQENGHLNKRGLDLEQLAKQVLAKRPIWFQNDAEPFLHLLTDGWKHFTHLRGYAFEAHRTVRTFESLFPELPSRLLIPAKRRLDVASSFQGQIVVLPDGHQLLNRLFHCKNQELGSSDRALYDHVAQAFGSISSGYSFDIVAGKSVPQIHLRFRTPDGVFANASECGLGMQDLLTLLYFALDPSTGLVAIEEPESHMHPDMQRRFLQYVSEHSDKQYFFSTHSNIFLSGALIDRVFVTSYIGKVSVRDETNRALVLSDLGYQVSDNLVSDLIILVEGPKDVPLLEALLSQMGVLSRYVVKFWPLGGDIMDQIDLTVFAEKYRIIALIDADPKSKVVRDRFREKCKAAGVPVHQLTRYALENYLSPRAVREVLGTQVPSNLEQFDPSTSVEKQLSFTVKGNIRAIARHMTLDEIKGSDLESFLLEVQRKLETHSPETKRVATS